MLTYRCPAILILAYGECAQGVETSSFGFAKWLRGARLRPGSRGWLAEKMRVSYSGVMTA